MFILATEVKMCFWWTVVEKLTSDSSNLLWAFQMASSKSRDVSAKAVANQMSFSNWILVLFLLEMYYM